MGPVLINGATKRLVRRMENLMRASGSCGLAAPQVGLSLRLFVFTQEGGAVRTVINPEIVSTEGTQPSEEGCLSLRRGNLWRVERPQRLVVSFQNEKGNRVQMIITGPDACVFMHEYDHLQGILVSDHGELIRDQEAIDRRRREHPSAGVLASLALMGLAGNVP